MQIKFAFFIILVGIVGGIGAWIFRLFIIFIFNIFYLEPQKLFNGTNIEFLSWLPFLTAPIIGGLIVGLLTSKISKEVKGHGVPEIIEAIHVNEGKMKMRIPFIKIIASGFTIGTGGSAGREGPIVQIGAGFGSIVGQKVNLESKNLKILVSVGAAAGISATFNSPIGSVFFVCEVILGIYSISLIVPLLVGSSTGLIIRYLIIDTNVIFNNVPMVGLNNFLFIPIFILLGIFMGIISAYWIKIFYKSEDKLDYVFEKTKIPGFLQPAIGGLFVGIILMIIYLITNDKWNDYSVMGINYTPMEAIFSGSLLQAPILIVLLIISILLILKIVSTIFTIMSGGSGGVFAPTIFIGLMLGVIFALIFQFFFFLSETEVILFSVVGMASFFAGTARAPLTAIIMTAELVGNYLLVVPLAISVIISIIISIKLQSENIYIRKLTKRGSKITAF
ncbi:MAG: chloride channel protein [Candidatus Lokiarchaeota archaeon]|nr:chloride channel protein [Candidatus Lokiarchaeota archaeon]